VRDQVVSGHLGALVPGQGQQPVGGDTSEPGEQRRSEVFPGAGRGQPDQADESAGPVHQGADAGGSAAADDEVAFEVADPGALLDHGRSLVNRLGRGLEPWSALTGSSSPP
jgi:hypothetical protein